jgi:hypothetical protein
VQTWEAADESMILLQLFVAGGEFWVEGLGLARLRAEIADAAAKKRELLLDGQMFQVRVVLGRTEHNCVTASEILPGEVMAPPQ